MLANALAALRDPEAIEVARSAVAIAPNRADIALALASAHVRVDQNAEARAAYERVLELDPHDAQTMVYLVELDIRDLAHVGSHLSPNGVKELTATDRQILERGTALADRAVELEPTNAAAVTTAAKMRLLDNRFDDAEELLDRAAALDPEESIILQVRAIIAAGRGDLELARAHVRSAAQVNPRRAEWSAHALETLDAKEKAQRSWWRRRKGHR